MKINSSCERPAFKPITLTIVIESEEERLALSELTGRENSVPCYIQQNMLGGSPYKDKVRGILRNFLTMLDHYVDPME